MKAPGEIVAVSGGRTLVDRERKKIGSSGDEPGRAKRMTFLLAHSLEAK